MQTIINKGPSIKSLSALVHVSWWPWHQCAHIHNPYLQGARLTTIAASIPHAAFPRRFSVMRVSKLQKEHTGDWQRGSRDWKRTMQSRKYLLSIYREPGPIPLCLVVA